MFDFKMPRFVTITIIPLVFSTIVVGCSNSEKLKQEQIAAAINSTGKLRYIHQNHRQILICRPLLLSGL